MMRRLGALRCQLRFGGGSGLGCAEERYNFDCVQPQIDLFQVRGASVFTYTLSLEFIEIIDECKNLSSLHGSEVTITTLHMAEVFLWPQPSLGRLLQSLGLALPWFPS